MFESSSSVEELVDLGFGRCRLQVQVPEKGDITRPEQLIGRNIVTSFTGLTGEYFERLEREAQENEDATPTTTTTGAATLAVNGAKEDLKRSGSRTRSGPGLQTKIKFVGGSVEAACALGVADGIVDLVGVSPHLPHLPHHNSTPSIYLSSLF